MDPEVSDETDRRFRLGASVRWLDAGDAIVVYDWSSDSFFDLPGTARSLWNELAAADWAMPAAVEYVLRHSGESRTDAVEIVSAFVDDLIARGVLVVR